MDYIIQMEKLCKYLELNSGLSNPHFVGTLKQRFYNDFNLLGCFIKDFLTIQNSGNVSSDENLYNDFVLYFDKFSKVAGIESILSQMDSYSKYYLMIVFEETDNPELLSALCTVNSCFALDCYPFLMELLDDFYNQRVDSNSFSLMLKSIVDIVIKRFENPKEYDINFANLGVEINKIILENSNSTERLAG